ncbi:MAG: MMPL family transporter [Chloroflexota bacterium]
MRRSRGQSADARAEPGDKSPPLMLRHPRRTLALVAAFLAVLIAFSFSLEGRLEPSTLQISGTDAQRANSLLSENFGESAPFVILLRGNAAAIDRQGPKLIRALRRDPKVTTLSPWDRGLVERLRPTPRRALIIADFHVGIHEAVKDKVPLLERTLEETIHPPVQATQSSFATLTRTIQNEAISSAERSELIALPILLVVLLLVFRSPVAAAIPLGFGAAAVLSSRGLLSILTHWIGVDALALTVCTMMGLALGVDYSLLMVSRFREELAAGATPIDAAWAMRRTAGRTTVFAGSTLVLSMLVALMVVPGALLASLAATLALVVTLTVLIASLAGPPILMLVGTNIDRWRVGPRPDGERSRLMTIVSAALRRPAPVAAAIGLVVLILAGPALALKTGPFSLGELPQDNSARQDAELIQRSFGGGFEAPFVLVAATDRGPITEPPLLAALGRWQRRIAATKGVESVIGPTQVTRAVEPLRKRLSSALTSGNKSGPLANLSRLGRNLGRAAHGVAQLREGISKATYGAGLLAQGSGQAEEGAFAIAQGLGQAVGATQELVVAIEKLASGTKRVAEGQETAALGALAIKTELIDIPKNLRNNVLKRTRRLEKSLAEESESTVPRLQAAAQATSEQLATAEQQLEGMTVGKADPNYGPALEAVRQAAADSNGLPGELAALGERLDKDAEDAHQATLWLKGEIERLERTVSRSKELLEGEYKLRKANNELAHGAARLNRETQQAPAQLELLGSGAAQLAEGLTGLAGGSTELQHGLGEAYSRSQPAQNGLGRMTVRVLSQSARLNRQATRLRRTSPDIFDNGYFVLSALAGTRGKLHDRASEAVDLEGGGQAATELIFSRYPFNSSGSLALNDRLDEYAKKLGRETGLRTGVAGGPPTLNTYSRVTRERIPIVVAAITLATFLVLLLVLRALPLAAIAVGLNLATVGVAFGVLTILNHVPSGWPLGGRTYVDAVGATMIFGVVFGLSIDYAVFLLVRMREHYDQHGDNAAAIKFGLERTARVITGAAAIMMAVFIAFAGAPIATVSQLGIGLSVAVLLDATVVRIVLLPALMLLIGERVWWLPRPLQRALPRLNV